MDHRDIEDHTELLEYARQLREEAREAVARARDTVARAQALRGEIADRESREQAH